MFDNRSWLIYTIHNYSVRKSFFFCPITFEISSQSPNIISKIVFRLSVNSDSDEKNSRGNEPIIGKGVTIIRILIGIYT